MSTLKSSVKTLKSRYSLWLWFAVYWPIVASVLSELVVADTASPLLQASRWGPSRS